MITIEKLKRKISGLLKTLRDKDWETRKARTSDEKSTLWTEINMAEKIYGWFRAADDVETEVVFLQKKFIEKYNVEPTIVRLDYTDFKLLDDKLLHERDDHGRLIFRGMQITRGTQYTPMSIACELYYYEAMHGTSL